MIMRCQKYYLFSQIRQPNLPVYKCVYHCHPKLHVVFIYSCSIPFHFLLHVGSLGYDRLLPILEGSLSTLGKKSKQAPWSSTPAPAWSGFLPSSACFLPFFCHTVYTTGLPDLRSGSGMCLSFSVKSSSLTNVHPSKPRGGILCYNTLS